MATAKQSMLIKNMLELLGVEGQTNNIVPLPNVNGNILEMVITWADHHKDDPPQEKEDVTEEKKIDDIPPWDLDFLKVDQRALFELMLAANYLDIKGLMDMTCKTVAGMIKGMYLMSLTTTKFVFMFYIDYKIIYNL